ncbi:sodium:calcium antiporter [Hyphococcus sp.]|uniref:sodium:calcium antiporter n=1 Tax=Hyphococcus sp. TaxID=2038636 RepID=UPI003CCC240A
MIEFSSLGMPVNIAIFAAAAIAVWIAGTKIAFYADQIAQRTGLGEALMGLFLLAFVTSLPEIATSFTAARIGDAPLAVNNLLGSIAMQVAVLALADLAIHKRALTSVVPDPAVMLQGALNICLLAFVAIAVLSGDVSILGAGAWTWVLFSAAVFSFIKLTEAEGRQPWIADLDEPMQTHSKRAQSEDGNFILAIKTIASAATILIAGYVVAVSGEALAEQSGLGSSFVGVALVAIATSLPEASTVFASMRRGLYTMAISDILGTNILNVALLFGVDVIATGDPVLTRVGNFAAIGAMLGVAVTGIFLMGLAERRDRTIWRMGVDSMLVLAVYLGGLVLLYSMRGTP